MALYTSENIFITPDVALTRGGLLLIALLAGGDYHEVCFFFGDFFLFIKQVRRVLQDVESYWLMQLPGEL